MTKEMMYAMVDAGLISVAEYVAWVQANAENVISIFTDNHKSMSC
jgi:hypothetical protein